MTPHDDRWLSRRDWRRLVDLHAAGRISRADLAALKDRLARVRGEALPSSRPAPRLLLLRGGAGSGPGPRPLEPTPREAA
jgi:hypothetical protein